MKEIETLQERVSRIDQLKSENAELRARIERAAKRKPGTPTSTEGDVSKTTAAPITLHNNHVQPESQDLILENERITKILENERHAHKRALSANQTLQEKCRSYKDQARRWQEYHDRGVLASRKALENDPEEQAVGSEKAKEKGTPLTSFSSALSNVPSNSGFNDSDTTRPIIASSPSDPLAPHDNMSSGDGNLGLSTNKDRNLSARMSTKDVTTKPLDIDVHLEEGNSSETSDELSTEAMLPPLIQNKTHTPSGISVKVADYHRSDTPIVVSERSLKRKRQRGFNHLSNGIYQDTELKAGCSLKPVRIKSEHHSSSSVLIENLSGPDCNLESVDLDAVGDQILTPTKRRRLEHLINLTQSQRGPRALHSASLLGRTANGNSYDGVEDQDVDGSTTIDSALYAEMDQLLGFKQREERQQERHCQVPTRLLPDAGVLHTPEQSMRSVITLHNRQQEKKILERQIRSEHRELQSARDLNHNTCQRSQSEPTNFVSPPELPKIPSDIAPVTRRSALQPKTPNAKILPRTNSNFSAWQKEKSAWRKDRDEPPISILAEDVEDSQSVRSAKLSKIISITAEIAKNLQKPKASLSSSAHLRLGSLLEKPSPEKPLLLSSAVTDKSSGKPHNKFRTPAAKNTDKCNGPSNKQRRLDLLEQSEKDIDTMSPDDEPLRSRPLHRLCLDDFKINPYTNQGVDYAFNEVVRRHDQRRCLPNCRKPECCGSKFRDIIKIGGFITPQKPGLWDSSPLDDHEVEQRLVQEFLGISRSELNSKSDTERQRALEDAKASYFAKQHGKHKSNGHQNSPPGFWNTDFPTTQEMLANKRESDENERVKVEERYREAKRPNGKWKFRDE